MSFRAKLSETKQCRMCGWLLKVVVDPDAEPRLTGRADVSAVRCYQCVEPCV
jgi:hypothetical protein